MANNKTNTMDNCCNKTVEELCKRIAELEARQPDPMDGAAGAAFGLFIGAVIVLVWVGNQIRF